MTAMSDLALSYARKNRPVFPCHPDKKSPLVANGFKAATTDIDTVEKWWKEFPSAMVGLPTGDVTDIFVLDIDERDDYSGSQTLAELEQTHGKLPETYTVFTPSGGKHMYFKNVNDLKSSVSIVGKGLDIRANGGYVIAAGSFTSSGTDYQFVNQKPVTEAPDWLVRLAKKETKAPTKVACVPSQDRYADKAFRDAIGTVMTAPEGQRNHTLNQEAYGIFGLVKAGRLNENMVRQMLTNAATNCGLEPDEIEKTIVSACDASVPNIKNLPDYDSNGGQPPIGSTNSPDNMMERLDDAPVVGALMQNPTEDNVALAFGERHRKEYIFMHGRDAWFIWDGTRWKEDKLCTVREEMRSLARAYNIKGNATAAKNSFINGCLSLSQSDPYFARLADDFDNNNFLLNCPDGTWNLLTGQRQDHNPDDHITLMTAVSPCNEGGALFLKFLDEVFDGDQELINFMQVALGSCLSGAIEDHWLMFWIGNGRNGKNTLGDLIVMLLGEYAKVIPSDTLMSKKNSEHKTEIVNLKGCRLAVASETEEGDFWAESKLKSLTGDALLSGRFMRKDFIHFKRTHKHLIYGNHRPQVRSLDKAMRSRLKVVPFNVSFAGREDATLPEKLWNEAGFVLHWLMAGHRIWINQGRILGDCKAIRDEVDDYFSMQLTVENWIDENCFIIKDDDRPKYQWHKTSELYGNFSDWCKDGGAGVPSINRFGEKLRSLGYRRITSNGKRYVGISLK